MRSLVCLFYFLFFCFAFLCILPMVGSLGYLASAISGDTWAALVVEDGPVSELDRWALAVVDTTPGVTNSSVTLPLVPRDVSGTISISGLGLA